MLRRKIRRECGGCLSIARKILKEQGKSTKLAKGPIITKHFIHHEEKNGEEYYRYECVKCGQVTFRLILD